MRITHVMLTKGFGGAERSFVDTVLALANRGHQVQAICQPAFVKRHLLENVENVTLDCVQQSGWWDELAASRIRRAIVNFHPDVVHAHLARGAWLAGRAVHRLKIPLIAKLHNYANLTYYKYVTHFIGTTADQRSYLQSHNYSDSQISVIPNFSRLAPVDSAPIALECSPTNPCTLITCGRLDPVKGFDILLKAFHLALKQNRNLRLIIGGEGQERSNLEQIIRELKLEHHVELAGWIDDVPNFLDRGDLYVLSSRSESFGIALLEAMSRGLPVVTTRTKGPGQLLSGQNAWFADTEDEVSLQGAILQAASQPDLRQRRGQEMVEIYKTQYYEDAVLGRFEKLYQSLKATKKVPSCFQLHDDDQMLIRSNSLELLKATGVATATDAMNAVLDETLRDVDGRQTGILHVAEPHLQSSQKLYLKRHRHAARATLDDVSDGEKEFKAVLKCEQAGIPTLNVIACGVQRDQNQYLFGSFLITTKAGGGISADQLSYAWRSDPQNRSQTEQMRGDLIRSIAETAQKLHSAKLYHQDLYWSHFFPSRSENGEVTASLIDVQRLTQASNLVARFGFQIKDLAQMRFSMEWVGLTSDEVNFFYDRYFDDGKATTDNRFQRVLLPTLAWLRTLGRLIKLRHRRRQRSHEETVQIELGPAPYATEIPVIGVPQHKQSRAA